MRSVGNIMLVLVIAAFVGTAAYVLSSMREDKYDSTVRLSYGRVGTPPELQLVGPQFGEPDVDEEVKLATATAELESFDVAEKTAREYPVLKMNASTVASSVNSSPVRETLIVEVLARADNGFVAAVLAKSYVDSYLKLRREREAKRANAVKKLLRERLLAIPARERDVRGAGIREQIAALDVLIRVGTGIPQVIESPRPSSERVLPKPGRDALFGVLFGLAVGAGLVALRTGTRDRRGVAAAKEHGAVAVHAPPHRR